MLTTATLLEALFPPKKPEPERPPLFPIREGVWYKLRDGSFAYATERTMTDGRMKLYQYRRNGDVGSRFDHWWYYPETGRGGKDGEKPYDIVAYADEPATGAWLPMREGVEYRARNGQKAVMLSADKSPSGNVKLRYTQSDGGGIEDWWVDPESGRWAGEDRQYDIVGLWSQPAAGILPLKTGMEYRTASGKKVVFTHGPDNDDDMRAQDVIGHSRYWNVKDGKHRHDQGGGKNYGDEHDVVSLWNAPAATATPPPTEHHMPDATPLIAALMHLNRETLEASTRTVAEMVLAAHRDKMRAELTRDIAQALEQPLSTIVAQHLAKQTPVRELVVKDKAETRTVISPHPKLEEAIEISRAINNIWLCGPAGSGKTTLAHQLAESMGMPYAFISCTAGMSEAKLLGRMNVQGAYLPAEFVRIYEEGGVFLWDEFDAADPNVVLCANAAMANGHLSVPDRVDRPVATRHPNTILVVATNTWGRGSTSEYTARETLDAATRDRFVLSKIEVGYAPSIEWQYLGGYDPLQPTAWQAPKFSQNLQTVFVRIRANIEKHHLRRVMSTRAFAQAAALRQLGWNDQRIVERYFLDWTEQERAKALEGVC